MTSTAESWEILSLAHKLSVILEHLQRQLAVCKGLIGESHSVQLDSKKKKKQKTWHTDCYTRKTKRLKTLHKKYCCTIFITEKVLLLHRQEEG